MTIKSIKLSFKAIIIIFVLFLIVGYLIGNEEVEMVEKKKKVTKVKKVKKVKKDIKRPVNPL
jgi:hypothetical protein